MSGTNLPGKITYFSGSKKFAKSNYPPPKVGGLDPDFCFAPQICFIAQACGQSPAKT